jgi:arginase
VRASSLRASSNGPRDVDIALVLVPYHAGDERAPSSEGPQRLLNAGAVDRLAAHDVGVTVETIDRGGPYFDTGTASLGVNRQLASVVGTAIEGGRIPIVLSGSCNSALGVVAGFEHAGCGAVWLDAHGDFNTPESSASGFFPGMSLAIVTGHCYRDYWAHIGDSTPLEESSVALFGVRDLSPEKERDRLRRSGIAAVEWRDGRPGASVIDTLDDLRRRVPEVYLHVDFDAFAPDVAPAVADAPVAGGLSQADAEEIIRGTGERFAIRAVTIATYTPERDEDDKTLRLALELLDLLGELAAAQG